MTDYPKSFRLDDEHGKETLRKLMEHQDKFINTRATQIYQRLTEINQTQPSQDNLRASTQATKQPPPDPDKNPLSEEAGD